MTEQLWCAACGKETDHKSGNCPKLREVELQALERELAYSAARADIECYCNPIGTTGDLQWDTSGADEIDFLTKAVRYLELRGLLERHPDMPNLVRVLEQPEG